MIFWPPHAFSKFSNRTGRTVFANCAFSSAFSVSGLSCAKEYHWANLNFYKSCLDEWWHTLPCSFWRESCWYSGPSKLVCPPLEITFRRHCRKIKHSYLHKNVFRKVGFSPIILIDVYVLFLGSWYPPNVKNISERTPLPLTQRWPLSNGCSNVWPQHPNANKKTHRCWLGRGPRALEFGEWVTTELRPTAPAA